MVHGLTRSFHSQLARLEDPWQGTVEMVFATAAVAVGTGDGSLLTVLDGDRDLVPWGVATPPDIPLPALGDSVVLEGGVVGWRSYAVRLSGTGTNLGLSAAGGRLSSEALARQLDHVSPPPRTRALLGDDGTDVGLEHRVVRNVVAALDELCRGLVEEERAGSGVADAVHALVGLGPGLTPSGDDVLVGVTGAALRLGGAGRLPREGLDALVRALEALPPRSTTPVARQMLAHAGRGAFAEPLARLLVALGDDGVAQDALDGLVEALAGLGSWSGSDMLAGALALARAWLDGEGGRGGASADRVERAAVLRTRAV